MFTTPTEADGEPMEGEVENTIEAPGLISEPNGPKSELKTIEEV